MDHFTCWIVKFRIDICYKPTQNSLKNMSVIFTFGVIIFYAWDSYKME